MLLFGMDLADGRRIGSTTCDSGESKGPRRRLSSSIDYCSSRESELRGLPFRSGPPSSELSSTDTVVVPLLLTHPGRPAAAVSTPSRSSPGHQVSSLPLRF